MKKPFFKFGLVAGVAMLSVNAPSYAGEFGGKLSYVGLDLSTFQVDYEGYEELGSFEDTEIPFRGVNPYVGVDLNKNIAVELGYLYSSSSKESKTEGASSLTAKTEAKFSGFHVDLVGKYNVSEKAKLLGSLGIVNLRSEISSSIISGADETSFKDKETKIGARYGIGFEFTFEDNFNIRGMVRNTDIEFEDMSNNILQYSIGLNYQF